MKRKIFLLLLVIISILTGTSLAEARDSAPWHGAAARQYSVQRGEANPLHAFLLQEAQAGHLDRESLPAYAHALQGLPHREAMLPYLREKSPGELRRTLQSLVRKERAFIGPFVYYSAIRNYEQILVRHVDLRPVIGKIQSRSLREDADGWKVFNNYERLLPRKPRGWYHEVRVRTERLRGPGPQRLVYGKDGEIYYTPDHYKTFHLLEVRIQ